MDFLLFQIYASMQAWGTACPGITRPTEDHPTKSGILGLTGACLGLDFGQVPRLTDLQNTTGFACRIDIPGRVIEDLHTVQHESRESYVTFQTIMTERFYLTDALFTVCLWKTGESEFTLDKISEALCKPAFTPYLGRSGCLPALHFAPLIVTAENLRQAFGLYVSDRGHSLLSPKDKNPRVFWEYPDNSITATRRSYRYDAPKNRQSRTFVRRLEYEGRL